MIAAAEVVAPRALSLWKGPGVRKVRTAQGTVVANGDVPSNRERKVPQKRYRPGKCRMKNEE